MAYIRRDASGISHTGPKLVLMVCGRAADGALSLGVELNVRVLEGARNGNQCSAFAVSDSARSTV